MADGRGARLRIAQAIARRRVALGFAVAAVTLIVADPTWASWRAGLAVAVAGEALRIWAAGHLEKSREVTRSGPYRWLRHPLYAGSSLIALGSVIAARHALVAAFALSYMVVTLTAAIRAEESFLRQRFGDAYDRYLVRLEEMRQSARIVVQAVDRIPSGPILADEPRFVLPAKTKALIGMEELIHHFMLVTGEMDTPKGEAAAYIENPKGIHGYYIRSEGGAAPWRLKMRAPSFANLQILKKILPGCLLADVVAILASIDFVMGECDK